ncbi:SulP family inorganic anion transporter [Aquabacterium sp. OR-4]|uniref:SulP family inorganic anion transporter n=1 Tax=Aquabacterium sp. OR-4 TaxID=2978127 RepID=UPI0021B16684|nr:SulP family inorganic anion transporter [Aquabacterium sp. OR-4]MDT7834599.1 SulP family inorganic anion transporter [Aquabacterium sp. OR-4]
MPVRVPLHPFRPRLLDTLSGYSRQQFAADLGAGLTVGIVALPLAMAFAIASGVKPEAGLFTAIIAGFLISALGGSQVQIGGPAGAFIVIVYGIIERYGLANLLIATSLAGVLLFLMGWLRLGALVRYIPVSIVIGFTNGIAVLIGLSQVKDLLGLAIDKMPGDFFSQIAVLARQAHTLNPAALLVGLACLALVVLWPKSYAMPVGPVGLPARARRLAAHVPGTIVALVLATLATLLLGLPVETIGSRFGGIPQALPQFALPELSWATAKLLVIPTITIALLGAIESLLCARVADNLAPQHARHDPNQELMAQGLANLVTPFFGGIPATGTIARTVTNVRAGAASPVAGIVHAATLLAVVLVAAPLALHVPLAALAGILLFVAWNMGEWREFARLRHFLLPYRATLLGTFVLTVVFDLTVAVEMGLLMACGFFIYRMSTLFTVQPHASAAPLPPGVVAFELFGSLFFGAVGKIERLPSQVPAGTRAVVLEMHRLISMDTSGLDALRQLHGALQRQGAALVLANVNPQPLGLVRRSGFEAEIGAEQIVPSVADAALITPARADAGTTAAG